MILGEQLELRGQAQFVHRLDRTVDDAEGDVVAEPLPDHAGAETPEFVGIGEVHIAALRHDALLVVREKPHGQPLGVRRAQDGRLQPDGLKVAEPPPDRAGVDGEMDVGGSGFLADRQILVNVIEGAHLILGNDLDGEGGSGRFRTHREVMASGG